jgi:hypothetical protein
MATDVQSAIDEIAQGGGGGGTAASAVSYDNTGSGLTATDVQDAIDEVYGDIPTVPSAYTSNPAMDGTASPGSSGAWAKGDHVHPTDTSRVPNYGKGQNLLRNWYFVGGGTGRGVFPVNQRGKTSYSGDTSIIDGWTADSNTSITFGSSGMTVALLSGSSTNIYQRCGTAPLGKALTLSVLTSTGLATISGTMPSTLPSNNQTVLTVGASTDGYRFRLYLQPAGTMYVEFRAYSSQVWVAAQLELGSEQTLAHQENGAWVLNDVPDYEYELYRCITSTADSTDTYANKSLATRQDLTSIQATGTTNNTGAVISAGAYFYLNGVLHRAKTQIDVNATFTPGTNCELVPKGGLNAIQGKMHLVWTNTGASVSFAGQTLSLDLSQYDLVLIEHLPNRSLVSAKQTYVCRIGNGTDNIQSMYLPSGATTPSLYQRTISVTTSGITFGDGFSKPTTATARTTDNNAIHPRTIYGIKL